MIDCALGNEYSFVYPGGQFRGRFNSGSSIINPTPPGYEPVFAGFQNAGWVVPDTWFDGGHADDQYELFRRYRVGKENEKVKSVRVVFWSRRDQNRSPLGGDEQTHREAKTASICLCAFTCARSF